MLNKLVFSNQGLQPGLSALQVARCPYPKAFTHPHRAGKAIRDWAPVMHQLHADSCTPLCKALTVAPAIALQMLDAGADPAELHGERATCLLCLICRMYDDATRPGTQQAFEALLDRGWSTERSYPLRAGLMMEGLDLTGVIIRGVHAAHPLLWSLAFTPSFRGEVWCRTDGVEVPCDWLDFARRAYNRTAAGVVEEAMAACGRWSAVRSAWVASVVRRAALAARHSPT